MKEAFKKHKNVVVFVAAIIIIIICCIAGYMAKIKYEQKQEKIRLEKIETTNNKIKKEYDDFKKEYSEIPWLAIKGLRNKIVHNYGVVNMVIVYDTVMRWIPDMYEKLKNIQ